MIVVDRQLVINAVYDAGLDPESNLYENYSGRFMFGEKCFGIVGGQGDAARFIAALQKADYDGDHEIERWIGDMRSDGMGLESIFYWPGVNIDGEDDDGQS